jgi:hypothetical protein
LDNLEDLPVEFAHGDLRDQNSLRQAMRGASTVYHCAADYRLWCADMRDKVQDAADQGRRTLHDRQDQAYALAQEARSKAQSVADETTQSLKRLLEEQPILMAALGAALGAAVGAALPLSRQEKELLGSVGATAVGAGREALSSAAGVLREEVAQADVGAKVSDLADKVVQTVTNGSSKS